MINYSFMLFLCVTGMLKHTNGNILKPLLNGDSRSDRELLFYQKVTDNSECDPIMSELKDFIPSFHGTWEAAVNGTSIWTFLFSSLC